MKILIDTNVIMDVLVKREHFYVDSARVWTLIRRKFIAGYLSAISINNLYYIVNKLQGQKIVESFVDQTLKDFEDLIQYFSALHEGCDFLVTRNKKDFPSIGIKIISPGELLKRLGKVNKPKSTG